MGHAAKVKAERKAARERGESLANTVKAFGNPDTLDEEIWRGAHLLLIQALGAIAAVLKHGDVQITEDLKNDMLSQLMIELYDADSVDAKTEFVNQKPKETLTAVMKFMDDGKIPKYSDFYNVCQEAVSKMNDVVEQ